jgi:hypothetical protein
LKDVAGGSGWQRFMVGVQVIFDENNWIGIQ